MRRGISFLYLLFLLPLLLTAQDNAAPPSSSGLKSDSEDVFTRAYGFIDSYPYREEGSYEEAEVFQYIERFASERGFPVEYMALDGREDMHSFSSNLLVRIDGESDKNLILAVPVDSYGIGDMSAFNPAIAMAFINEWTGRAPPVSLLILFTSADMERRNFLGSLSFLSRATLNEKTSLLYLLLSGNSTIPEIKGSTAFRTSPGWYMESIRRDLESAGIGYAMDASGFLVNRAGLSVDELPLDNFLKEDIPAAAFVSSDKEGPDLTGQYGQWLRFLHSFCVSLDRESQNDWESNFVYWAWNKKVLFYLSERAVLLLSLALLSLALALMLIQQRKIRLNFKRFRKHLWAIPVIIYLIFTFYMISTLFLEELLIMTGIPDLWQRHSMYFLLLKVLNGLLFSSLFINLLRGLPFPRTPHLYAYMAFASGLVNIAIISSLNISFSPLLMIIQLFIFMFIFSRNPGVKRLAVTLAMVPQLLLLSYLFNRDYPSVFRFFLLSRIRGNWFLTLFSLPVICMMLAQHHYHHHYERSRQEMKTAIITFMEALVVLSMIIFSFQLPLHSDADRQLVRLRDRMDLDTGVRELEINSNREIGEAILKSGIEEGIPVPSGVRGFNIRGETEDDLLFLSWKTKTFLERRSIDLDIRTKDGADEIRLEARSEERLVLYDSLYPYELSPDQKSLRIFIGINPPNPLGISLIFSGDSRPELHLSVLKDESGYSLIPAVDGIDVESRTVISKTLSYEELKENGSYNKEADASSSAQ